jgi:hypothetical protein
MRFMALVVGLIAAGAASAGELQSGFAGSDEPAGQLVYEARFGGHGSLLQAPSFQLRLGSDHQFVTHQPVPFLAEYRTQTGSVLLNGVDISPMFVARQAPEGGVFSALGGWIPLLVVLTAATAIVVDGNRAEYAPIGTGGSGA